MGLWLTVARMWLLMGVLLPGVGSVAGVFIGPLVGLTAPWWAWALLAHAFLSLRNPSTDEHLAQSLEALREQVAELLPGGGDDERRDT